MVGDLSESTKTARRLNRFQSLFWWIVVGDPRGAAMWGDEEVVSILVLVDRGR